MLEKAIEIAARAHRRQIDKAGDPYILHVLRVMLRMTDETGMVEGVLHDIIENTPWTSAEGFPAEVVQVIQLLSRNEGESYEDFISRLAPDPLARSIKIADLEDNMNLSRLPSVSARVRGRLDRYQQARPALMKWTTGGSSITEPYQTAD